MNLVKFEIFHHLLSKWSPKLKGQKCLGCPDNGPGWRHNHRAWRLCLEMMLFPLGIVCPQNLFMASFYYRPPIRSNYCASTWKFPSLETQDHPSNQHDTVLPAARWISIFNAEVQQFWSGLKGWEDNSLRKHWGILTTFLKRFPDR